MGFTDKVDTGGSFTDDFITAGEKVIQIKVESDELGEILRSYDPWPEGI